MNSRHFPRSAVARGCAAALLACGIGAGASALLAATAAGTQIRNLATVTYEDAAGNVYSAQSNEAIITVAQVYSATLERDTTATATPGQTVYLPFTLTNTGNGADDFDISADNDVSVVGAIPATGITVYLDSPTSPNGVPDSGEPEVTGPLTLAADGVANLIVAVQVPSGANVADEVAVILTAEAREGTGSAVTASVDDLTAGNGADNAEGTNQALITVVDGPVLVTTKSAVHDAANNEIDYTVTVRNNGNRAATDVLIFDGLPAGTTFESVGVSGLLAGNGDTIVSSAQTLDEAAAAGSTPALDFNGDGDTADAGEGAIGLDLNNDGDTGDTGVQGVYAVDAELPPGTTVSLTFTVSYDPAVLGGGYVVENQGHATADTDGTAGADVLVSSNLTQTTVNAAFDVDITDTGVGGDATANDGGDDDSADNDIQRVDQIAAGGTALFDVLVSNQGNSTDTFDLTIAPGTFPAGTVFTPFEATGVTPLTDTGGAGVPDTGPIPAGETRTIRYKVTLPAATSGDNGGAGFTATVTATSAGDGSQSDTATLSLGAVVAAQVDLHNATGGTIGTDEDPIGTAPYAPVTTFTGSVGTLVSIPLYIDNESGGPGSFVLGAGSSFDGTTLGSLPSGWQVEFFLTDAAGDKISGAVSSTPVIPAGTLDYKIIAEVTIPNDSTLAVNDYLFDNDGDGDADDRIDGNTDGDGDYPIFFQISSSSTGAVDTKLDAIDVDASRVVSLVTPSVAQVEPGGTVDYGHTLSNTGNVSETLELSAANSQSGFTNAVRIDTNGDGDPDTRLTNLTAGTISVQQGDGTVITVTVTDADGDGDPELVLEPGFSVPLLATVFAPANAAPGTVDQLTISATNTDTDAAAPDAQVVDQTTVINTQLQIVKTVALDAACDGSADGAFAQVQSAQVEPGQCAVWRVTVTNSSAVDANNVIVSDTVPPFSAYLAGSLRYCLGAGCTLGTFTDDPADNDAAAVTGSNIVFYVGDRGAAPTAGEGGVLVPGQQVTTQFAVTVQ